MGGDDADGASVEGLGDIVEGLPVTLRLGPKVADREGLVVGRTEDTMLGTAVGARAMTGAPEGNNEHCPYVIL